MTFEQQSTAIPIEILVPSRFPNASRIARLSLHQSQRCQAIPTLSVLLGKVITARQLWILWSDQTHRQTGVGVYTSIAALLETWLTAIAHHHDLRSRILQSLAALAHRPEAELTAWLAHTSDYQRQLFWQQLTVQPMERHRLYNSTRANRRKQRENASDCRQNVVVMNCVQFDAIRHRMETWSLIHFNSHRPKPCNYFRDIFPINNEHNSINNIFVSLFLCCKVFFIKKKVVYGFRVCVCNAFNAAITKNLTAVHLVQFID